MSNGTRYEEGDKVRFKGSRTSYEVLHIIDPESQSPDYVIQSDSGDRQTVKASEIRKLDEEWDDRAQRELEEKLGVETKRMSYTEPYAQGRKAIQVEAVNGKAENGEREWLILPDYSTATKVSQRKAEEHIERRPQSFNEGFLRDHIYVSDTDARMIAQDDARALYEGHTEEEIMEEAQMEGFSPENVAEAREKLEMMKSEEFKEKIKEDPMEYFVGRGIYSEDELFDQDFIRIDAQEAAEDAVSIDGEAHFLDRYDGAEVPLESGAVAYGLN